MDSKNKSKRLSLHPLTPEQALSAALRVKPSDMVKLEAADKLAKAKPRRAAAKK